VSRNVGTGAGEITPDGCAVDFYALLPAMGEPAQRRAFLAACGRHVDPLGTVVVQQAAPSWFDTVAPSERERPGCGSAAG
jgi:hypothetical protein